MLIEGFYKAKVDRNEIKRYFAQLTKALKLRMYGKPIIFSPGGAAGRRTAGTYPSFRHVGL